MSAVLSVCNKNYGVAQKLGYVFCTVLQNMNFSVMKLSERMYQLWKLALRMFLMFKITFQVKIQLT